VVEYNFIIPVETIDEVIYFSNIDLHTNWQIFAVGDYCWSLQTYLVLKNRGLPVHLSRRFDKRYINIAGGRTLQKLWKRPDVFVVDIKADVPRDYWGRDLQLVQNKTMEDPKKNIFYLPLWPQANLIKRNPNRKIVRNVAYAGRPNNLLSGKGRLKDVIERLGLKFKVLDQTNWNDYSNIDICIGIRSYDKKPHKIKPATKLYNSWHAQVPFIGGYESAFETTGTPGKNYIRVENEDELVNAIVKLRNNPDFYQYLVKNGNEAREHYNWDSIANDWIRFLQNIAAPKYRKWKRQSMWIRAYNLGANAVVAIAQELFRIPQSLPNRIKALIRDRLMVNK